MHRLLSTGHQQVIDADLSGYFDSIPHAELMKSVARRIVDRHVLHLIKQWLEAPVEEDDGYGYRKRTTSNVAANLKVVAVSRREVGCSWGGCSSRE